MCRGERGEGGEEKIALRVAIGPKRVVWREVMTEGPRSRSTRSGSDMGQAWDAPELGGGQWYGQRGWRLLNDELSAAILQ